jgi:hypothetical protein
MAETIPSLGVPSGYEESGIMILRNRNIQLLLLNRTSTHLEELVTDSWTGRGGFLGGDVGMGPDSLKTQPQGVLAAPTRRSATQGPAHVVIGLNFITPRLLHRVVILQTALNS